MGKSTEWRKDKNGKMMTNVLFYAHKTIFYFQYIVSIIASLYFLIYINY